MTQLFNKVEGSQARLKAGFMGFAGDGKTYTAALLMVGLVQRMRELGLEQGNRPVFFLDTETGAEWVKPLFDEANIELQVAKTRAFSDLRDAIHYATDNGSGLIVDSVTHFWRRFTEEYVEQKRRRRGLEFQDWAWLKTEWARFTDAYVNEPCHAILCGRAGYEYDYFEDDAGKRQLEKTGVKMKAETETGYEPNILIQMEKHRDLDNNRFWHTALILKDRSTKLHGMEIRNPTFESFRPHVDCLNLGGKHTGFDASRNSLDLIGRDDENEGRRRKVAREVALEVIVETLKKHHGGQTKEGVAARADLLEKHAKTRSWTQIEKQFSDDKVFALRDDLYLALEGVPYNFVPPVPANVTDDVPDTPPQAA